MRKGQISKIVRWTQRKRAPEKFGIGEQTNFWSVHTSSCQSSTKAHFVVQELFGTELKGVWVRDQELSSGTIELSEVGDHTWIAYHHYKYHRYKIVSWHDFLFHCLTLKARRDFLWDKINASLALRKMKFRADRIEVLADLVDSYLEKHREDAIQFGNIEFSYIDSFTAAYGKYVWSHKDMNYELKRYELIIGSLISAGDLHGTTTNFQVAPKALETLSRSEEEDQRHKDFDSSNKKLIILTAVLALAAVFR